MSLTTEIAKLHELHISGALTADEFARAKSALIAKEVPTDGPPADAATLRIVRNTWGGWLVSFLVELDGIAVGELAHGETLEFLIPPGEYDLRITGGGAFVGRTERIVAAPHQTLVYTVGYTWYGGTKLARLDS